MLKKSLDTFCEVRPWGKFETLSINTRCTVKILYLNPYSSTSLQYHFKRDEYWKILEGSCFIFLKDSEFLASKDDSFYINKKTKHRIKTANENCSILEISFGLFDESDIIRIEDDYERL